MTCSPSICYRDSSRGSSVGAATPEEMSLLRIAITPRDPDAIGHSDQDLIMIAQPMSHLSSPSDGRAARSDLIGRARRILGTRLKYIDHAGFDDPNPRDAILAPSTDSVD